MTNNFPKHQRKATVIVPNESVDCIHRGALAFGGTCFAKRGDLAHVECAALALENA